MSLDEQKSKSYIQKLFVSPRQILRYQDEKHIFSKKEKNGDLVSPHIITFFDEETVDSVAFLSHQFFLTGVRF